MQTKYTFTGILIYQYTPGILLLQDSGNDQIIVFDRYAQPLSA